MPCSIKSSRTRGLPYARQLPHVRRESAPDSTPPPYSRPSPPRSKQTADASRRRPRLFRMSRSVRSSRFLCGGGRAPRARPSSSRYDRACDRPGPRHPQPQGRRRQIEIAGNRPDRLVVIEYQAHSLVTELLIELPAWPPALAALGHPGHRIRLSERVHEIGPGRC